MAVVDSAESAYFSFTGFVDLVSLAYLHAQLQLDPTNEDIPEGSIALSGHLATRLRDSAGTKRIISSSNHEAISQMMRQLHLHLHLHLPGGLARP